LLPSLIFCPPYPAQQHLPSFPTRRSSDLTGLRKTFPVVRAAVARVIDPARVRWIGFSHFEADECGALNDWLALAPRAQAACGVRSEEHTSELQSRVDLVCRLLLEKQKREH